MPHWKGRQNSTNHPVDCTSTHPARARAIIAQPHAFDGSTRRVTATPSQSPAANCSSIGLAPRM